MPISDVSRLYYMRVKGQLAPYQKGGVGIRLPP